MVTRCNFSIRDFDNVYDVILNVLDVSSHPSWHSLVQSSSENTKTTYGICSKLIIKTLINDVVLVPFQFQQISHIVLLFLLLTFTSQCRQVCEILSCSVTWTESWDFFFKKKLVEGVLFIVRNNNKSWQSL